MLVSSIECLSHPESYVVNGVCIASNNSVESVRLFSNVPFDQIQTLALDASSMTSNALAQIILSEKYQIKPEIVTHQPDITVMLDHADAAVIIGDNGMTAHHPTAEILDLGQEWATLTGLPFVWALWIAHRPIPAALADLLRSAVDLPLDSSFDFATTASGWPRATVERYLTECVHFTFQEPEQKSLELFQRKLKINHLVDQPSLPKFV
jgi:chorismate dehydratase